MAFSLTHSHISYVNQGNASAASVALITDSIKLLVKKAMNSATLCKVFVDRAFTLNVTFLMTAGGIADAGTVCTEEPVFTVVYAPGGTNQPTSQPSSQPSSAPSAAIKPRRKRFSSGFIGFLVMVAFIWFLRFYPALLAMVTKKEEEKAAHLYDILVVISEDEEAILENIKHQDIAFYRRTNVEDPSQSLRWTMNATSDVLEKRFEVQFLDHFDLLGDSGPNADNKADAVDHSVIGDKLVTKEVYVHDAGLQMGMIIKVKPYYPEDATPAEKTEDSSGNRFYPGSVPFGTGSKSPLGRRFDKPDSDRRPFARAESDMSIGSSITEATRNKN